MNVIMPNFYLTKPQTLTLKHRKDNGLHEQWKCKSCDAIYFKHVYFSLISFLFVIQPH